MRRIDETLERHILAETASTDVYYVGLERSVSAVDLPNKSPEKNANRKLHLYGEPRSPLIIMNFGLLGGPADIIICANFCIDRLRGFCSARC
jgi:hypothetical protein